jgi:hypothetical protein
VRADGAGRPLAIELGAVELYLLGEHRYRHLDFRGNVKLVSDARGRVVSHIRYGPYGADLVHGQADPEAGFALGRSLGDSCCRPPPLRSDAGRSAPGRSSSS